MSNIKLGENIHPNPRLSNIMSLRMNKLKSRLQEFMGHTG